MTGVSVVVISLNEGELLRRTIDSLRAPLRAPRRSVDHLRAAVRAPRRSVDHLCAAVRAPRRSVDHLCAAVRAPRRGMESLRALRGPRRTRRRDAAWFCRRFEIAL
jgi:hypothetical protein